jgi:hypothetical protein
MDGGLETASTHSEDGANDDGVDNNGIYSSKYDDDDGHFTYHSSDGLDVDDEDAMRFWATAGIACHPQCLHLVKMVRILILDRWRTCQIGSMKLKQITHRMHHCFLLPPSPRFFCVLHARTSKPHNRDTHFPAEDKQYHMEGV